MTHWIWWAIGTFGIGGVAIAIAVFLLGWPAVIGSRIGRMALAAGAALGAVLIALAKARQQGQADELARQERENAAFRKAQKERDAVIADSTDADLDDRLRDNTGKP